MSALWLGLKWDYVFFFVLHRSGELVMDWNERDSDEKLLNCPLLVSERLLYSWPPPKDPLLLRALETTGPPSSCWASMASRKAGKDCWPWWVSSKIQFWTRTLKPSKK